MVDPKIAGRMQPYLMAGERLTWTGQPPAGLMLGARDLFLIPFSMMWGGFAIFWESNVLRSGAPGFFALWGVPFVLIGLYLIFGRFFVDAWVRGRTSYALTNGRALVLRSVFGERLLTTNLNGSVEVRDRRGERGTLGFSRQDFGDLLNAMRGFSIWMPSLDDRVQFLKIDRVMDVYRLAAGRP
ncbi:hypothetical protein [Phenylobacterium sp.]|uniref:hypothetical protein n=1 Tax=Phenylobacterium sp. TaxID=1871053 RepID=UPI0030F3E103